jgi:Family of unknown function (DUF6399)
MEIFSPGISDSTSVHHKVVKRNRATVANNILDFESAIQQLGSQRAAAESLNIPRSTWRHWRDRKKRMDLPSKMVNFFESPEGTDFLHLLMTALLFVMSQLGNSGTRLIGLFLRLSKLDRFIGNSYGSIQNLTVQIEKFIEEYGQQERNRLATEMEPKEITMCGDETFHPEACLVAIEPVSNFILAEKYSEKRDAASWAKAMSEGLSGLSVKIVQSTSDEGKGLLKYVNEELGAHHSPDLFHVQQELTRATSAPLNAQVKHAESTYQASCEKMKQWINAKQQSIQIEPGPGRPIDFDKRIIEAEVTAALALEHLKECENRKAAVKEAKKTIGMIYHPYDLKTGKRQTAKKVGSWLEEQFEIIQGIADEADLSENSQKRLAKAHRVFTQMVATISFFWETVKTIIADMMLPKELESVMHSILIPAFYLEMVSKKASSAEEKKRIMARAQEIISALGTIASWQNLEENQRNKMEVTAKWCAGLFQRSSSCVEGRNGYLSLRHHGLHKLSKRKLFVLTTLHNYYVPRADGSTAAERFFGKKPRDLFDVLLKNLRYPPRPRSQHKRAA